MTALLATLAAFFRRHLASTTDGDIVDQSLRHQLAMLDGRLLRDIGLGEFGDWRR